MREGDIPSVKVLQALTYIVHLKYAPPASVPERGTEVQ